MDGALDRDKSGEKNPLQKHSIATRAKPINTEAANFLLSDYSFEALQFTIKYCSLETRHDHIFKATGLVLSKSDSTGF